MRRLASILVLVTGLSCGSGSGATDDGTSLADAPSDTTVPQDPSTDSVPPEDLVADPGQPEDPGKADESPEDRSEPGEVVRDTTPPTVVRSDPANDATDVPIPFLVKVTFSEPIRFEQTVDADTFQVKDFQGNPIQGTRTYDPTTWTVTFTPAPTTVYYPASPYQVVLSSIIQDLAGNRLNQTEIRFSTAAGVLEDYEALAIRYAPLIYQSVNPQAPQFDYPTSFDFDGDWKAQNNDQNLLRATRLPATIHWDVVETRSHLFLRYAWFYPRHVEGTSSFGNEVAGSIVVVAKQPSEDPIAVETYFGAASKEDVRSFVTVESGIVKDGAAGESGEPDGNLNDKDRKYFGVNWVFPKATLFPGGHYQAYLTKGTHESCAWVQTNKESTLDFRCQLNDGVLSGLSILHFAFVDGVATEIQKGAQGWPVTNDPGNPIGYGLKSVLREWWSRRDRLADLYGSQFTYEAPAGRPGGGIVAPTSFQNTTDPQMPGGRPPWAWSWKPTVADPDFYFKQMPQGSLFFDPAWYFSERHRIPMTAGSEGFSSTYCFHPYLRIDRRGADPDCPARQAAP